MESSKEGAIVKRNDGGVGKEERAFGRTYLVIGRNFVKNMMRVGRLINFDPGDFLSGPVGLAGAGTRDIGRGGEAGAEPQLVTVSQKVGVGQIVVSFR